MGASQYMVINVRNGYGFGRSFTDFLRHFWLMAVPTRGVNNEFDYPLGLSYLLALGPFIYSFVKSIQLRKISILAWFIVIYWISWFFGSQQSRWLFLPLSIMFLMVSLEIKRPFKSLVLWLVMALVFNFISIFRAFSSDIKRNGQNVVREQDKLLIQSSEEYLKSGRKDYVLLTDYEVAYARFPVMIREEKLPNVVGF